MLRKFVSLAGGMLGSQVAGLSRVIMEYRTCGPAASVTVNVCPLMHKSTNSIVVEAGGVEPPSEKARNEENYVRIRLMVFDRHL